MQGKILTSAEAERKLLRALVKYGAGKDQATVVKKWIYESRGDATTSLMKACKKFFELFPEDLEPGALEELALIFQDAWNLFPHRELGGRSPNQMVAEAAVKTSAEKATLPSAHAMPKIVCGGREMEWDDYQEMLREMERRQEPFKKWIRRSVLPQYERLLRSTLSERTAAAHLEVADIFFDRVLHLGFLDLESIRPGFVQKEFPRWWTTHVLMDNKKSEQVLSSLRRLFKFLGQEYGVDIAKFGF